jgi:hypothetical protein
MENSVANLSAEVKAQAVEAARPAAALMARATSHHHSNTTDRTSSHEGGREALMHTQGAPGKSQEAMSPTDSHKAHTNTQHKQQNHGRHISR